MKNEFKPGDFARFPNEQIPRILDILRANGYRVETDIIQNSHNAIGMIDKFETMNAFNDEDHGYRTELTPHDFMCIALRLEDGMGILHSTVEQRSHVWSIIENLGIDVYPFHSSAPFFFNGKTWLTGHNEKVTNPIPYTDWCRRLCVEPIHVKSEREINTCEHVTPVTSAMQATSSDVIPPKCVRNGEITPEEEVNAVEPVFDPSLPYEVKNEGIDWYHGDKLLHYVGQTRDGHHAVEIAPNNVVTFQHIRNIQEFNASMLRVGEYMEAGSQLLVRLDTLHFIDLNRIADGSMYMMEDESKLVKGRRVEVEIVVKE